MIHTNIGFRLSAYLNNIECSIQIADGPTVHFDEVAYTEHCTYKMDYMVHDFWASGSIPYGAMNDTTVGLLRLEYRLFSFEGQGDSSVIEQVVPVVARGTAEQRFGARYRNSV